jgi:hypothetical protein
MNLKPIQEALDQQRFETARRLALAALAQEESIALRLLLHEAWRRLGDYVPARASLESLSLEADEQRFEVALLLARIVFFSPTRDIIVSPPRPPSHWS